MGGFGEFRRSFGNTIRAGRVIDAGPRDLGIQRVAERDDAVVIGCDHQLIKLGALAGTLDHMLKQGLPKKWMKRLSGEAGGGPAGRNDTND